MAGLVTAGPAGAADRRTVSYHGVSTSVPADWPVYDLAAHPSTCVRFDRHAVYLGSAGGTQRCPGHLVGRTEALWLQPWDGQPVAADAGATQARHGNVLVTASYGSRGAAAARALVPAGSTAVPRPTATAVPATSAPRASYLGHGAGFDTCAAPSAAAMEAWSDSPTAPKVAVGIYVGGLNRACPYGNLTADWVKTVRTYGYHFIPTYVGRQAPCSGVGVGITPSAATRQGQDAARDAITNLRRLGLGKGSPVYLDLENYDGDQTCQQAVLQFVSSWVDRLHLSGYLAGLYTSSWASIVRHHNDSFRNPDAIWLARWNGAQSVAGDPVVPDQFWAHHQRIHQYQGGHPESHNSVTLNIDNDWVDGPLG